MDDKAWLVERFEVDRSHLRAVEVRGAAAVADTFKGRATAAQPALVDGVPGLTWAPGGKPKVVFGFRLSGGKIVGIELVADQGRIAGLDIAVLG